MQRVSTDNSQPANTKNENFKNEFYTSPELFELNKLPNDTFHKNFKNNSNYMINSRVYYSNLKLVVNKGDEEEKEEVENANNAIYVGNINKYVEDDDILRILQMFGNICKWHRQRNPSTNELMPFGFCEFSDIYGVYLCINILDNIKLTDKNLKVNCNDNLKKKFEKIVDILYEKRQKTKESELLSEKDMKCQILSDIKKDMENKKNDVLAYIENINNEYEEKKKKEEELQQNNVSEDGKNLNSEERREKNEEEIANVNDTKLKHDDNNVNFIDNISSNNDEINSKEKKKKKDDNDCILKEEKENNILSDNSSNQQLNNKNVLENNSFHHDSEEALKESEKEKEEIKYISKDYKVNWREKERIQRIENKEKDLEKEFYKREKEWLELEEHIKKDTYREWNKLMLIKKKDIAKLIELDLKGEYDNSNISSSKKREIRNSKREKEKELDEIDRLNELKEIEEMKEKERLRNEKILMNNDNKKNTVAQNDEPKMEEYKKEEENDEREKINEEEQKNVCEEIKHEKEKNKDDATLKQLKSSSVNNLSYDSDENNGTKNEEKKIMHDEYLKRKNQNFENDDAEYLKNKYNWNDNTNIEKENNFREVSYNKNIIDNICNKIDKENYNNELILLPHNEEDNLNIKHISETKENKELNKTYDENKNNLNENSISGNNINESNINENIMIENNTNKRKFINSEHINIKVNDKKKKTTDSESVNKTNNPILMNVFNTNDEDELFTKRHQPLSKLDKHLDKKNQEEEKIKAIEIIENSKKILEKVPSTEEEIFNFPIEWKILNLKDNIGIKLKPWIYKKITEYIGKDEKEIIEEISNYFVQQILNETSPKDMLIEAEKFLDSDGKKFILNMYRLIIFEQLKIKNNL